MQKTGRFSKKAVVLGATFGLAVALTATAFAYWTTTGEGSGSAQTGTSVAFVITSSPATGPALTPDGAIGTGNIQTVAYNVHNPATAGSQQLNNVAIKVANPDGSAWTSVSGCSASDYSVGGAAPGATFNDAAGLPVLLAANGDSARSVTVQMINKPLSNQNGCKNVVVPLYFLAS